MTSNRRIIIIAGAVVALIAVLVAIYFIFFSRSSGGLEVGGDPFGGTGAGDISTDGEPSVLEGDVDFSGEAGTEVGPQLVRITDAPVAHGVASIFIPEIPAATSTDGTIIPAVPPDIEVRFVERRSGNVYAYRAHGRTLTRISNQTIPGVQEAEWVADGSLAYLRFLSNDTGTEHIETYALPAIEDDGYFLEQDLAGIDATSTTAVLSLKSTATGSIVTVARPDGSNARSAFTTALTDIVVAFFGRNYLVHTAASASADGYVFQVTDSGAWSRLVGPLRGLTAIPSPTGSTILYSYVSRGTLITQVLDVASRVSTPLPISTIVEKCVYARDGATAYCAVPKSVAGTLPDDWYQGAYAFSDRIWKIDLALRAAILLIDPSEIADIDIDAVALTLDPLKDILTFTNKRDGSLWAYDL